MNIAILTCLLLAITAIETWVIIFLSDRIKVINRSKFGYKVRATEKESHLIIRMANVLGLLIEKEQMGAWDGVQFILLRNSLKIHADEDGYLSHEVTLILTKIESKKEFKQIPAYEIPAKKIISVLEEKIHAQ